MKITQEVLNKIINGELLQLDVGSGNKHKPNFIRLDKAEAVNPDILCDLDTESIPLPDKTVVYIEALAVMEHVKDVIHALNEFWRVCTNRARIWIAVPHPFCDDQWGDPTHRSCFTFNSFTYWSKGSAHYTNTDYGVKSQFGLEKIDYDYDPDLDKLPPGITKEFALKHFTNMITRINYHLIVEKGENNG